MNKLVLPFILFISMQLSQAHAGIISNIIQKPIEKKITAVKKDVVYSFLKEVMHIKGFIQKGKVTNGDYLMNIGVRGTINLSDVIDMKFGLSEYFTSLRKSGPFALGNHSALRGDIGFFLKINDNISIGYVWSGRNSIDGYTPTTFDNEIHSTREWLEVRCTL